MEKQSHKPITLALFAGGLFLAGRLVLLLSLPLDGVKGYGDYWNFFAQAGMGLPYIDFWTEFPPVFPYLSKGIHWLSAGREQSYVYILSGVMSLFQACTISIFILLANQMSGRESLIKRAGIYLVFTIGLFYGWGYFDVLAVFFMLLGMYFSVKEDEILAGGALAVGALTKWFPVLAAPAVFKTLSRRAALRFLAALILGIAVVWIGFYLVSPQYTVSSFKSQGIKGSWESIWALIDGNLNTGNFGSIDRALPITEKRFLARDPVLPPWMTLLVFGGAGFYLWHRATLDEPVTFTAFTGLTTVLFFLWSPGYSPQWVLYLLPLVLLVLPVREASLWSLTLILVNLLEWPVLLSRGSFTSLYWLIPLRTVLYLLLGVRFYNHSVGNQSDEPIGEVDFA